VRLCGQNSCRVDTDGGRLNKMKGLGLYGQNSCRIDTDGGRLYKMQGLGDS